jgi:hypothetical protein
VQPQGSRFYLGYTHRGMLIEVVLVIALLGVQSSSGPPAADETVKPKLTSADIFRLRTEAEGGDVQAQLALAQA